MIDFRKLTVYQIYPKSFKDSDGDGLGDLQGIIEKLDYIEELGVNCIWLTPIYPSPQKDNGYDVADYTAIDPRYGTMDDFDHLVTQCKKRDIIIMLDMVFNHTSDQHPWFQKAITDKKNKDYKNYYIFKVSDSEEPTNWISKFGGSTWEKINENEYYLHLFDKTQPDLNWENPQLRQEIYNIMEFWLKKGIRSFRFDVINLISKPEIYVDDHIGDGRRFYTDGPKIHEYLKELHKNTFGKYENTVTVGEMSSTTIDNCIKYSNPEEKELDMTFSFHHLKVDYENGDKWSDMAFDFLQLKKILIDWQIGMEQGGGHNALFWCNHDQPRIVSRFGNDIVYRVESAKMLATAMHMLKGTPYVYQGEEIGMTNPNFTSIDRYRDVESINYYAILKQQGKSDEEILKILRTKSRDNSRTPVQWNSTKNSGFTTGTPWIDTADNYTHINVVQALEDENSVFYHYKKLIKLRKDMDIISYGRFEPILENHNQIFAYLRKHKNEELLVVNNFYKKDVELDTLLDTFKEGEIIISNYDNVLWKNTLKLRPYESFVIKSRNRNTVI